MDVGGVISSWGSYHETFYSMRFALGTNAQIIIIVDIMDTIL